MRGRTFILIALILILGVVAAGAYYLRFSQPSEAVPAEGTPTPVIELVDIVVAVSEIPRGTIITEDLIGLVSIPRDLMVQGWFTDFAQVLGRRARFDLGAGAFLTANLIVDTTEEISETGSTAALVIPRGYVAVAIPVTRLSSVAYGLQDGDHVNVIATLLISDLDTSFQTLLPNWTATVTSPFVYTETGEAQLTAEISAGGNGSSVGRYEFEPNMGQPLYIVPSEPQRPRLVSQTLLQDVIVLHVGDFPLKQAEAQPAQQEAGAEAVPTPIPPPSQAPATKTTIEEPPTPPDIITLVVTPQDAVTLNYLLYSGAQLSLALRPAGDDTRVQTESVTLQFLFNGYNFAVPEKLPYGMEPRIDVLKPPVLANDIPAE